jgi:CRISPR-associated endonuclease Cas2
MRYLITYDIVDARRSQRVQRHLQQCARALQRSVYLFEGSAAQFTLCLSGIDARIDPHHDDVRLYAIANMASLRLEGRTTLPEGVCISGNDI